MIIVEVGFWAGLACVVYTYAAYPLALALLARWRGRPVRRDERFERPSVSIVLAAHNEESVIGRRLSELGSLLETSSLRGEIILVSDGSTDQTAEIGRTYAGEILRVLELPENLGKAAALNEGYALARHEILVFVDARQTCGPASLERLLENFADPSVGAACGDLVLEAAPGVMAGVGLYWRFEKWLRMTESRLHSSVGLTGSICAVRRELFRPIPPGTILDDVYWPLQVVMQGARVIHDDRAHAYDRLPERTENEFRRKVRTLAGNFQLVTHLPSVLLPWKNPIAWQFVSHKLLRLLVPWALLGLFLTSAMLPGTVYRVAFWGQVWFYLIGLVGFTKTGGNHFRLTSAIASFLVLNTAAWFAFWVWALGRANRSWRKVNYEEGLLNRTEGPQIYQRSQQSESSNQFTTSMNAR